MAQFTNQAQLRYNNTVTNSNIAVGEVLNAVSVTKTAVGGNYSATDAVSYVISIRNGGTADLNALSLADDLGAYQSVAGTVYPLEYVDASVRLFINGTLVAPPAVTAGPPLSFTGINIPAGGEGILVYDTRPTEYALLGQGDSITNTVTVNGTPSPAVASATIVPGNEPVLSISKSVSPVPVSENGTLTYTFIIENNGNTAADTGVVISDVFSPILSNINVTLNGTALTPDTDYTYNTTTGEFATTVNTLGIPAAQFSTDARNGARILTPGVSVLTVSGTV